MTTLREELAAIVTLYTTEFAPKDKPDQKQGQIGLVSPQGGGSEAPSLVVSTEDNIESQEEYDRRKNVWKGECQIKETQACEEYLSARIEIVLMSTDQAQVVRRVGCIGWMNEPGTKLFIHDALCAALRDWKKMRLLKKGVKWGGNKVPMTYNKTKDEDSLALVKALYQNFKQCRPADSLSEDILVVIVPGPAQDSPEAPAVRASHGSLQKLDGRHVGPKIGTIAVNDDDVLSATGSVKTLWRRPFDDYLVWTYQAGTPPVYKNNNDNKLLTLPPP